MVATISVWGINVVFLIQGRLSPFMLMVLDQTRPGTITGAARVPTHFRLIYDPLRLSHP